MKAYKAPTGSVWELEGSVFVLLEGYENVPHDEYGPYRRAFSLTQGVLSPFGLDSWMDNDSKRIA